MNAPWKTKTQVFFIILQIIKFSSVFKFASCRRLQRLLAALLAYLNNPIRVVLDTSQICNTRSLQEKTESHKFSLKIVDTHYTVNYKE